MHLNHGRPMVAIPGPSVIPDRVLAAMHRPMPNIYAGELHEVAHSVLADLPAVARSDGEVFIAVGNGHAGWQMAISNTLSAGDRVLVLESGRFAVAWGDQAAVSGVEIEVLAGCERGPVDPGAVEERLRADSGRDIAAVMVVQVDTASSVRNDIAAIRRALDDAGHPALLMVDAIASLGCERYEMDEWGVDVTVAGSQKGLMVPPGLAFVWAGDRALDAHRRAGLRSGYWDWTSRMVDEPLYLKFAGTPPVSHLYGLREALDMIAEEGLVEVWARHDALAGAVRAAVDVWAAPGGLELNVTDPAARSNAVTTVRCGDGVDVDRLRAVCEQAAGLTLGLGIGDVGGGSAFRIGHMGHINPPMVLGTISTVEAGLDALGAPMGGSGAAAAAAHVGRAIKPVVDRVEVDTSRGV